MILFRIFISFILLQVGVQSCTQKSTDTSDAANLLMDKTTSIEFFKKEHSFGILKSNEVVKHYFKFQNTGKENLIILETKASCNCTVPKVPDYPVKPNKMDSILVEFDPKGQKGIQFKTVRIYTNTIPVVNILRFKAEVI
jgi:hypothetical protein